MSKKLMMSFVRQRDVHFASLHLLPLKTDKVRGPGEDISGYASTIFSDASHLTGGILIVTDISTAIRGRPRISSRPVGTAMPQEPDVLLIYLLSKAKTHTSNMTH
jgi:hypothetical protein